MSYLLLPKAFEPPPQFFKYSQITVSVPGASWAPSLHRLLFRHIHPVRRSHKSPSFQRWREAEGQATGKNPHKPFPVWRSLPTGLLSAFGSLISSTTQVFPGCFPGLSFAMVATLPYMTFPDPYIAQMGEFSVGLG